MMQWIEAHQALLLLAWPVLTAAFSLIYTQLDHMPRVHAFFSALASLGIDLPKLFDALGRLVTKNAPPGAGGGSVTPLAGPYGKVSMTHKDAKDSEPPPTLRRIAENRRGMRLFWPMGVAGALALTNSGCSFFQSPQGQQTIKTGVDLAVCVLNHINEPIPQIATDCGAAAVEDVVRVIDAHRAATVREKAANDAGAP